MMKKTDKRNSFEEYDYDNVCVCHQEQDVTRWALTIYKTSMVKMKICHNSWHRIYILPEFSPLFTTHKLFPSEQNKSSET